MILAIDVGNTNIVLGCFDDKQILFRERISTNQLATDLEYMTLFSTALKLHSLSEENISGAIISSVVPSVTNTLKQAITKLAGVTAMVVGPGVKTGLSIMIDNPATLGADLAVDAAAAISEYKAPMIIIDMGTATTMSVVDKNKNYIGGVIMTGMAVSSDALTSRTSQLPRIAFETPKKIIGTNTVDCMKSGIMFSTASALDGMIERMEEELGEKCTVIATGGLAPLIIPLCKRDITLDEDLLLKGLMVIYNKNKKD
ncbi:type III pantothenate kinase [Ruminococcus sp. NK3A76]|uniref:type III pantothenate kinase n=1 Tax=Ruminococcus sp. NK3A76 TaxID=877411 RepID=UPI00048EA56F|nr:type III pantothenate kinase [Ruminococcus sp. NK3A76]